jgi:hypothetical protein
LDLCKQSWLNHLRISRHGCGWLSCSDAFACNCCIEI